MTVESSAPVSTPPASDLPRILLTGASGVLGRAVVRELAPYGCLTVLVHRTPLGVDGVRELGGSILDESLGLSPSGFRELAAELDCIVHCAATSDYAASDEEIWATNVEGTKRVVELAAAADARLYHVGTAAELAPRAADASEPSATAARFSRDAYVESKRAADELVRSSGVTHSVLRPSVIVGDSRTGEIARFQGIHTVMRLVVEGDARAVPFDPSARADFLPQDAVAQAIGGLARAGEVLPSCWLTAGEHALTVRRLLELCVEYAATSGSEVAMPKFIRPELVDRLVRPALMSELPRKVRQRFEYLLAYAGPLVTPDPLPSDWPELERRLGLELPDLEQAFRRSLEYWDTARRASHRG